MKKIIITIVILALAAILAAFVHHGLEASPLASDQNNQPARPVRVFTVQSPTSYKFRAFPGLVESTLDSTLAFRVGGVLIELPALAGKSVQKGDLLARLDNTDFKNTVLERRANFDLAKAQLVRTRKIFSQGVATQADLDKATANHQAAAAALNIAQDNLRYTQLIAPFNGVIAKVIVDNYEHVQSAQPVLYLQATDQIDVRFGLPESLLTKLNKTQLKDLCTTVYLPDENSAIGDACYKEHESIPDPITRTYPVYVTMSNSNDIQILPGMSVEVRLDLSQLNPDRNISALARVPVEAVYERSQKTWVWKVDDNFRVKQTEITVDGISNDLVNVTGGLVPGDQVVTAGLTFLKDGQQIRPLLKERGL